MTICKAVKNILSIKDEAALEVEAERRAELKAKMKKLLRDKASAEAVLRGIEMQIADLEQQINDGTA